MKTFLKKILSPLISALILEDVIIHRHRRFLLKTTSAILFILIAIITFYSGDLLHLFKAGFAGILALGIILFMLECYFYTFHTRSNEEEGMIPFEIAQVLFYSESEDITKGFIFSDLGDATFKRLGILEDEIVNFAKEKPEVSFAPLMVQAPLIKDGADFAKLLFDNDQSLKDFLWKKGVQLKEFTGAFLWEIESVKRKIESERWWSKESLSKIPGLGKNWAYGETYILDKYGSDITDIGTSRSQTYEAQYEPYVRSLESILSKTRGANALMVSDDETSRMDIIRMFAGKIREGTIFPTLEHKRVYIINPNLVIEAAGDKISLERELSSLLFQSARAGNVIIVFPYFSAFLQSARAVGSDIAAVMLPFLASPAVHIIALDSKELYRTVLFPLVSLMEEFEVVTLQDKDSEGVMEMLKREAEILEDRFGIVVTYQALLATDTHAKRFFESFSYADKARDLLSEAALLALRNPNHFLTADHIASLIEEKTGVPTGTPDAEEKDMLLNLEDILHKRIIGQDEAIKAISVALRRSRAGVRNPDKPIGSFLFLGPTGVGKTETTKALAQIFFDDESKISRFDMSEFTAGDALERLIGSFKTEHSGLLSNALRERPYGVVLLDEFEKTTKDVMNLFLQVLDEGVFTDAKGRKVNARNSIIIATSNAGSELIWDIVKSGDNLASKKDSILDSIIDQGIFKPELLNRFDGVILFHPLDKEHLEKIADLQLKKLSKRLKESGIDVSFDESMISLLVEKGSDPKFGARPLARAIAEEIEEEIAKKIIAGEIQKSSKVSIKRGENGMLEIQKQ